ncbi:hypothetical protein PN498_10310 [Oscillatoria sp. CS-180]|uniref:hypothetical protein n=1 Tax=Oscillatoria sp. CS-180 TaxID=3021720 RepID=UPI00232D5936|nr:hypothetical protein [Oscillatoria sp. CS-180]MDB9526380.1 hypothetical protein [Oscillatoria sp. CS-180]
MTLSVQRDTPPDEEAFVSSSPASSETDIRLEFDLTNLDLSEEENVEADDVSQSSDMTAEQPDTISEDATITTSAEENFDGETVSEASALGTVEVGEQPTISREAHLEATADELNECIE